MKSTIFLAIAELRKELYLVTKEDVELYTNGQIKCEQQIDELIEALTKLKELVK